VQGQDPIGQAGQGPIVRHHDDCDLEIPGQTGKQGVELSGIPLVQVARRFVRQNEGRARRQVELGISAGGRRSWCRT